MEKNRVCVTILRIIAGIIWISCATASAFCFGIVSGLRGIGDKALEYPYFWYTVVFSYIVASGVLPAVYLFFGKKEKGENSR